MAGNKILVVRFSAIGDIVLTTPVVRCLKSQLDAEVHFLTKQRFAQVLHDNPYIDRILTIEETVDEVSEILRSEQYDVVIDLHHNLRSMQVKRIVGAQAFSFPKLNIEKWILVNFKFDWLPDLHIVDRYFKTTASLGIQNDGRGLDFFIEQETLEAIRGRVPKDPFVAVAIGAGLQTKCLEPDQLAYLGRNIRVPVILLGGPEDKELGDQLAAKHRNTRNLAGHLSLAESAAVLSFAGVLITPDTGLMHIAAALNKPIISVWGNTVPEFGMTPCYPEGSVSQHALFQTGALNCRPCSKIGYDYCPKTHFKCIRELPLDMIVSRVHSWLAS